MDNSFFCPLPWIHLSMEPGGNVYSCCNTSMLTEISNVKKENFQNILNSKSNKSIIDQFSKGEIPSQCKLCVDAEKLGQISLRESSLRRFPEITKDSKLELKYLSLRLDNICNLKCRTCGPLLSTSWYGDSKELGDEIPSGVIDSFGTEENFQYFLDNIPKQLEVLYFAGGEPLLSPKFYKILERLIENKKTDIEILINTNITKLNLNKYNAIDLLNQFSNVHLDLSIDGIEEVGEYIRKGMNWKETKEHIQNISKNHSKIHLKIFPTISILNIYHLPKMLSYFLDHNLLRPSDIRINPLTLPEYLCISNLPEDQKVEIKKVINIFYKELLMKYEMSELKGLLTQLNGIIQQLSLEATNKYFTHFIKITSKLDALREEKVQIVIPELKKYF